MDKDEALHLALASLESWSESLPDYVEDLDRQAIAAIKAALETKDAQVSPLQFVEMVMEKEHLVGKPIFWAEWPNKEKNT